MGKLSKDQFALAMYLIQQKVSKGIDPPQVLTPDMIPPSDRNTPIQVSQQTLNLCALKAMGFEYEFCRVIFSIMIKNCQYFFLSPHRKFF